MSQAAGQARNQCDEHKKKYTDTSRKIITSTNRSETFRLMF